MLMPGVAKRNEPTMMRRRDQQASDALAEQRRREDAAPRLRDKIVGLRSLRLKFEDLRTEGRMTTMSYARPIVVATAPAHFEIRCMEPRCDGRHDLTQPILRALSESRESFAGESSCSGGIHDIPCDRTLAYSYQAAYGVPRTS